MKTIFIGGSGRCGTKLLRDILGKHSKITALPFPTRFTIDPDGLVDTYRALTIGVWSPYIAGVKLSRMDDLFTALGDKENPKYPDYELANEIPGYTKLVHDMITKLFHYSTMAKWSGGYWYVLHNRKADIKAIMAEFMDAITAAILEKHGGEIFVDSNTWNPLFTPELMELCPDSIHIHIYRDPRDVVDSMSEQRWCPDDKMQCAMMYSSVMAGIRPEDSVEYPDNEEIVHPAYVNVGSHFIPYGQRLFEVAFEELVTNPKSSISKICDVLNYRKCYCTFDPAMLTSIDATAANIGRHKNDIIFQSPEMLEILKPRMERYGYE